MSVVLSARRLEVSFQTPEGEVQALGPLSVQIDPGEFVCLIGPSGCGKSTLIRVFAGLQLPTAGTIEIDGAKIDGPSPRAGLMFQQANLMPWRTVLDNIALPLELAGISKAERLQSAAALLPMLSLEDFGGAYPNELSGGMAQRTSLGRLLVQKPDVLLLDEPFGALDALTRERIGVDVLRVWQQYGQTVLMVTHDINEAVFLSDRVLVMSRRPGRLIADVQVRLPRPRQIENEYDTDFVAIAREVRRAIDRA